jgi:glycosyltransferase involved in cell wall biosynthesis
VREIMRDREHGRLVHPDRPGELARALRVLLDDEAERRAMGRRARAHIAAHFTWTRSEAMLAGLLHTLDPRGETP